MIICNLSATKECDGKSHYDPAFICEHSLPHKPYEHCKGTRCGKFPFKRDICCVPVPLEWLMKEVIDK